MADSRHQTAPTEAGGEIHQALRLLENGGVVAIPTDTLYGLAADAFDPAAIERVFAIKERPEGLALPVLLSDPGQLEQVAHDVSGWLRAVSEAFWPGGHDADRQTK